MRLADFSYELPVELIAQQPLADRAASRMLVVYRQEQRWEDGSFRELPRFLRPGDCLVLNDSKVFPSRLYGRRKGCKGKVEVFLVRPVSEDEKTWTALVHPGRKMRTGEMVHFERGLTCEVVGRGPWGERTVRFQCEGDLYAALDRLGHVPLPRYIRRPDCSADRDRYQTVYARERGSVAAPTAGLHFTPEMLDACRAAGADIAWVTLHVGLGTFQPLHHDEVEENRLHAETYRIHAEDFEKLRAATRRIAVGTTSVRALETALRSGAAGETDLFIYPGFEFPGTDALLTNFHLPRTSLLLLVCAFGGTGLVLDAYRHAVAERYRFYSYGDCMLIV